MNRFQDDKQLLAAGAEILDLVEHDEMHPTAAVVKVARDRSVPPNWIPLLVSGYNISAAARHRLDPDNDSILEKLADFPIAVLEDVQSELYPEKVETPASAHHKTAVHAVWTAPPRPPAPRPVPKTVKAAEAPKPERAPTEAETSVRIEKLSCEIRRVAEDFEGSLAELTRYFRSGNSQVPFRAWEYAATVKHADAGRAIADRVYGLAGLGTFKTARYDGRPVRDPVDPGSRPMILLAEAVRCANSLLDLGAEQATLRESLKTAEHNRTVPSILRDDAMHLWDGEIADEPESLLSLCDRTKSALFGDVLGGMVGGSIARDIQETAGYKPTDKLKQDAVREIRSLPHQQRLAGMQTDFVLRDLLHNDEVASHHSPEELTTAFNELAATAPNAMQQPAIVRAMMRKRLSAGVMDPVDIDQLINIERRLIPRNSESSRDDQ